MGLICRFVITSLLLCLWLFLPLTLFHFSFTCIFFFCLFTLSFFSFSFLTFFAFLLHEARSVKFWHFWDIDIFHSIFHFCFGLFYKVFLLFSLFLLFITLLFLLFCARALTTGLCFFFLLSLTIIVPILILETIILYFQFHDFKLNRK